MCQIYKFDYQLNTIVVFKEFLITLAKTSISLRKDL